MKNSKLEKFLDAEELSALENETLKGGADDVVVKKQKEQKEEPIQ